MAYDKVVDSAVLDEGLKQIADAIREKAGTTDALAFPQAMADAIAAIQGGGATIEPLTITENGTYTAPDGVDGYSPVTVDVKGSGEELVITDFTYFCQNGVRLDLLGKIDTSNGTNLSSMFNSCSSLTTIPELDTSNCTDFTYMFNGCSSLTTITELNLEKCSNTNSMFGSCKNLTNLYLYNIRISIKIGSGTSWGHLLTVDSLVHTIKELCTVTSSHTLTIGSANLNKIAGLYCRITDDTNEKKPMELCESTDEGAMTLVDYALKKGWNIQ